MYGAKPKVKKPLFTKKSLTPCIEVFTNLTSLVPLSVLTTIRANGWAQEHSFVPNVAQIRKVVKVSIKHLVGHIKVKGRRGEAINFPAFWVQIAFDRVGDSLIVWADDLRYHK